MPDTPVGPQFPEPSRFPARLAPLTLGAVLALSGCDEMVTAPAGDVTVPLNQVAQTAPLGNAATLVSVLTDLTDRIIPAMPDGSARDELLASFGALSLAVVAAGEDGAAVAAAREALATARTALARYHTVVAKDAAALIETDALQLGISIVALAVEF